jgi:hypothetical protein
VLGSLRSVCVLPLPSFGPSDTSSLLSALADSSGIDGISWTTLTSPLFTEPWVWPMASHLSPFFRSITKWMVSPSRPLALTDIVTLSPGSASALLHCGLSRCGGNFTAATALINSRPSAVRTRNR